MIHSTELEEIILIFVTVHLSLYICHMGHQVTAELFLQAWERPSFHFFPKRMAQKVNLMKKDAGGSCCRPQTGGGGE